MYSDNGESDYIDFGVFDVLEVVGADEKKGKGKSAKPGKEKEDVETKVKMKVKEPGNGNGNGASVQSIPLDVAAMRPILSKGRRNLPKLKDFTKINEYLIKQYDLPTIDFAPTNYLEGMVKRTNTVGYIKMYYNINSMAPNIVVFKLFDSQNNREINYGFLFAYKTADIPADTKKLLYATDYSYLLGAYSLVHFSFSASMTSADGEYRSNLIRWHDMVYLKNEFAELWAELDDHVVKIKEARGWNTYTRGFAPSSDKDDITELLSTLAIEGYHNMFFSATWIITIHNAVKGILESHINEGFRNIMLENLVEDKKYLVGLYAKYTQKTVDTFIYRLNTTIISMKVGNLFRHNTMGFKMIPLNTIEVQHPFDLKYKPWREYFVANRATDLVFNQVTPGLPIFGGYNIVMGSQKGLYDNKSQFERMRNSEMAVTILKDLHSANENTRITVRSAGAGGTPIHKHVSGKFKKLSDKIEEPIRYTVEELIMSDVTFLYNTEHVGRTFIDTLNLLQTNKALDEELGKPLTDAGYPHFAKYVFGIAHSLLALNKTFGAIHGDFHLNNSTIGRAYLKPTKDSHIAFYLARDVPPYLFPSNGYFGFVIDFSRVILNPEHYDDLRDKNIPMKHKMTRDINMAYSHETNLLVNLYLQLFPEKSVNKDEIRIVFKKYFSAVHKLMTAVDLYMFSQRVMRFLGSMKYTVSRKAIDLIDKINRTVETFIASEMNNLLADPSDYAERVEAMSFPNETVIRTCFSEFTNTRSVKLVTDCYSLDNQLKYVSARHELMPDGLKSAMYEEGGEVVTDEDITSWKHDIGTARDEMLVRNYDAIMEMARKYTEISGYR